jgi:RNA polymerase-binding transcription factor DksA
MKSHPGHIPSQWNWHHRALLKVRDALRRECEEHSDAARTITETDAHDAVDTANRNTDYGTLIAEIRFEEAELAEVEAALERLQHGAYGVCEATGQPIEPERLRALPWTRLCQSAATHAALRAMR